LIVKIVPQVLLRRFEHEKQKLLLNTGSKDSSSFVENSAACCSFSREMLCQKSAFEAWQDTFLPVDYTSLFWDMKLLQKLTSIHLDDLEGSHQVILITITCLFFPVSSIWLLGCACLIVYSSYALINWVIVKKKFFIDIEYFFVIDWWYFGHLISSCSEINTVFEFCFYQ